MPDETPRRQTKHPLTRVALRDSVYTTLLEMLMDGSLPPGASVSIDGVARELDVSPTPVREALVHLERTGLVSREALRGYRVAPPLSPAQIRELCRARLVLEVGAVEYAFDEHATLLRDLEVAHSAHVEAAGQLEQVYATGQVDLARARRYFEADWTFHTTLIRHTNNPYLRSMSDQLFPHIHRMRQAVSHGTSDANIAVGEHAAILAAVAKNDIAATRAAISTHLNNVQMRSLDEEA